MPSGQILGIQEYGRHNDIIWAKGFNQSFLTKRKKIGNDDKTRNFFVKDFKKNALGRHFLITNIILFLLIRLI